MFFKNSSPKKVPRTFAYTPFYYKDEEGDESEETRRIHFRRIRGGLSVSKRSLRGMVMLVILILFCMAYFWHTVERQARRYDIESIRIEEVQE